MGKYISEIGTTYQEKINNLITLHNAELTDPEYQPNLVCVVDNGFFAAAGYAYSNAEFKEFLRDDGRPKTWLIVPNAKELAK